MSSAAIKPIIGVSATNCAYQTDKASSSKTISAEGMTSHEYIIVGSSVCAAECIDGATKFLRAWRGATEGTSDKDHWWEIFDYSFAYFDGDGE